MESPVVWTLTEIRQRHVLGWKLVFGKLDSQAPLLNDKPAQCILKPTKATEQKEVEVVSHLQIGPWEARLLRDSVSDLSGSAVATAVCAAATGRGLQNRSYTKIVYSCLIHAALSIAKQPSTFRVDPSRE